MTTAHLTNEELWASWYGVQYSTKFAVDWRSRIPLLRSLVPAEARSILDVGTNLGWNLRALREIDPARQLRGIDINAWAAHGAAAMALDVEPMPAREVGARWPEAFDLVMHSGVLIHVGDAELDATMKSIIAASRKWILAIEYDGDRVSEIEGTQRTWERPFDRLYEELGLVLEDTRPGGEAYDACTAWLLRKHPGSDT